MCTVGWKCREADPQLDAFSQNGDGKVASQVIPDDNLRPLSLVGPLLDEDGLKTLAEGLLIEPAVL